VLEASVADAAEFVAENRKNEAPVELINGKTGAIPGRAAR
jgi:hypothetical protein